MSKITENEVLKAQDEWRDAIVAIGSAYLDPKQDVVKCAEDLINELYGYGKTRKNSSDGTVLFKPTKCEKKQFRPTREGALSYFVGHELAGGDFPEDQGFAIAPYVNVHFANSSIIEGDEHAVAMGNYFFVRPDGATVKVEYTFVYRRRGKDLVIEVHHSSLPYTHP